MIQTSEADTVFSDLSKERSTQLILMICLHGEHFSDAAPGLWWSSEPPFPGNPPLQWLAADLMDLAAVEEKQHRPVAYALLKTKKTHTRTRTHSG